MDTVQKNAEHGVLLLCINTLTEPTYHNVTKTLTNKIQKCKDNV